MILLSLFCLALAVLSVSVSNTWGGKKSSSKWGGKQLNAPNFQAPTLVKWGGKKIGTKWGGKQVDAPDGFKEMVKWGGKKVGTKWGPQTDTEP